MSDLILILGDQLSFDISSLDGISKNDSILIVEVLQEATYVPHHKKKLVYVFSAMRHFAESLKQKGYTVHYTRLDSKENLGSFDAEVKAYVEELKPQKLIVTEPGEFRVLEKFKTWQKQLPIPVEIRIDTRFLCSIKDFAQYAADKKTLRMEFFYREMRKKYNILLDKKMKPIGGKWNYDAENRNPPKAHMEFPCRINLENDEITQAVIKMVESRFPNNFGNILPFNLAVTREGAIDNLKFFIEHILPSFGEYQDAMLENEVYLYHANLSTYLNSGLLTPLEIVKAAEEAYILGKALLNSVEGFVRQILGWREYIRGVYWLKMPQYAELNFLETQVPLPDFYWDESKTQMNCIKQVVKQTRENGYSHHIQRLMITGNFALLAGILPKEVCEWYLAVYTDAYEWVELPNTLGMALFGDGGFVASKPYAASGNYINKMSNFCGKCKYDPKIIIGDNACPFNFLYWDFLIRNEGKLKTNQRLGYSYNNVKRMDAKKIAQIQAQAKKFLGLQTSDLYSIKPQ